MKVPVLSPMKSLLPVAAGTLLLSFAAATFLLPFDLVAGGVSGIAVLLSALFPALNEKLTISLLTWALFFVGLLFLGKRFALKTLVSTVIYPLGILLFSSLAAPDALNGVLYLPAYGDRQLALLLAALFGGLLIGAGCALTFLGGGSTGGVDVAALLICKAFPRLRPPTVIFAIDVAIITAGVVLLGNLPLSLLGILSAALSAVAMDRLFLGESQAFVAQIVTDRRETVTNEICLHLGRTASIVPTVGGYSGKPKAMLFVSFSADQYRALVDRIRQADPNAFVTIHRAHEVRGKGWK